MYSNSIRFATFNLCFLTLAFTSFSQSTTGTNVLTLQRVLEKAVSNYPSIKAKQAKKAAAEMRLKSSKDDYLPDLITQNQITYSTSNGLNGSFWPNEGYSVPTAGGIRPESIYTPVFGSFSTISLNWNIFNFGKIKNNVAYNKSKYEEATADYEEELFKHKIKACDAYLLFLVYEKASKLQEENYKRANDLYTSIKAYTNSGIRPGTDSSYARAELSKARINLLTAQLKEKEQKISLAELIGTDSVDFEVDTMQFFTNTPEIKTATNFDVKKHPYLLPYEKAVTAGLFEAKRTMSSYYPSFTLRTIGWARGSGISNTDASKFNPGFADGVDFRAYNYMIGATFIFNILDYPKTRHEYKAQLFSVDQMKELYNEEMLQIKGEYEKAASDLLLYQEQAKEAPVQLNAARAAYSQAKARYDGGLNTLPELTQNYYLLNRAENDMAITINNVWRGLLIKSAANGDLAIFLDSLNTK